MLKLRGEQISWQAPFRQGNFSPPRGVSRPVPQRTVRDAGARTAQRRGLTASKGPLLHNHGEVSGWPPWRKFASDVAPAGGRPTVRSGRLWAAEQCDRARLLRSRAQPICPRVTSAQLSHLP